MHAREGTKNGEKEKEEERKERRGEKGRGGEKMKRKATEKKVAWRELSL